MGQISLITPTPGSARGTGESNINTDLGTLQTVINGNLDLTNLSTALQALLTTTPANVARAFPGVDQTVNSDIWTQITLGTVLFDPGGRIGSSQYTVPTTGYYQVSGTVTFQENALNQLYQILNVGVGYNGLDPTVGNGGIMGTQIASRGYAAGDFLAASVSGIIQATAGNNFRLWGYQANNNSSAGVFLNGSPRTFMSVVRVA